MFGKGGGLMVEGPVEPIKNYYNLPFLVLLGTYHKRCCNKVCRACYMGDILLFFLKLFIYLLKINLFIGPLFFSLSRVLWQKLLLEGNE